VPIRFHLPADAVERVAFAYSPLLEAVLSLHVLAMPKHHPLQHPWVREMRRLDTDLKRAIGGFSFLYRATFPDCVLPAAAGEFLAFEDELERLRALDAETVAYELTRPLYDWGGAEPRVALLDDAEIRDAILGHARFLGPDTEELVAAGLDDPLALRDGFADLLARYWEVAFAAEWESVEPQLAHAVTAAGLQLAEHGLYAFLLGLAPQLRVESANEEFGLDVPHDHRVEVDANRTLVLVPSVYVWPHVRVNCDDPWPLTLVYPAPAVAGAARTELPPAELLRVLRALAEPTRLRVLRLIGERPRSTQELAPLIGISEAGLSKHLRLLAEAGLLETRREGYYVLYRLVPDRIRAAGDALPAFLEARPLGAGGLS
jgi:DNA-binding transcriptional ArsR family regulator